MKTKKFDYQGAFSPSEIWGEDKIKFCRSVLSEGHQGIIYDAENRLKFYEKFNPAQPHDRAVAQDVTAYLVVNPRWVKKGKSILPERDWSNPNNVLKKRVQVDFGEELKKLVIICID